MHIFLSSFEIDHCLTTWTQPTNHHQNWNFNQISVLTGECMELWPLTGLNLCKLGWFQRMFKPSFEIGSCLTTWPQPTHLYRIQNCFLWTSIPDQVCWQKQKRVKWVDYSAFLAFVWNWPMLDHNPTITITYIIVCKKTLEQIKYVYKWSALNLRRKTGWKSYILGWFQ